MNLRELLGSIRHLASGVRWQLIIHRSHPYADKALECARAVGVGMQRENENIVFFYKNS